MLRYMSGRRWLSSAALVSALVIVAISDVNASSTVSPDAAVPKKAGDRQKWPQASLRAQATDEVANDTVKITLAAEVEGESQSAVGESLTQTLKQSMARALEQAGNVKVSSGDYRVWPMNDKDGKITTWRGRSEISLESQDFSAASELAARLADLMGVSSLNFFVSPQTRAQKEEQLLGQAAQAFRARAQALADALGFAGYTLRSVDLDGSGAVYQPAPRAMQAAMFKSADSIPLEGGTEMISVSIQGSVFLVDEKK